MCAGVPVHPGPDRGPGQFAGKAFRRAAQGIQLDRATLKADIEAWHATGVETAKPSLQALRKRWNTVKDDVCVNAETGQVWWPECSKEAYADGIAGAVDAYWNWQTSRAGKRAGKGSGSHDSNAKAATAIGCASPPERCASSTTDATSRCR